MHMGPVYLSTAIGDVHMAYVRYQLASFHEVLDLRIPFQHFTHGHSSGQPTRLHDEGRVGTLHITHAIGCMLCTEIYNALLLHGSEVWYSYSHLASTWSPIQPYNLVRTLNGLKSTAHKPHMVSLFLTVNCQVPV